MQPRIPIPHPNDLPLIFITVGGEHFVRSPKKGWLWSDNGKAPTAYSNRNDAVAKLEEIGPRFHGKLEIFERVFSAPSRKRPYYRIRALFTEEDLHSFRGSFAGHKFSF